MPGRPQQIDTEEALEKAMLLFWELGYESTSLAALEQALGAGRQSIYNSFGNKKELFIKAYQHYLDTRLASALELLKQGDTPQQKLRSLFHSSLDCSTEHHLGCFIGNTVATPAGHQKEIEELSAEAIQTFVSHLGEAIAPLFTDKEKLSAAAWGLFSVFQGSQIVAKQKDTREYLLKGIDHYIETTIAS